MSLDPHNQQLPPAEQVLAQAKTEEAQLLALPEETDTRKKREQAGQRNVARRLVDREGKKVAAIRNNLQRATAQRESRLERIAGVKKTLEELVIRKPELLQQSAGRQRASMDLQST